MSIVGSLVRLFRPVHLGLAIVVCAVTGGLLAACSGLVHDIHDPKQQSPNIQDQLQSIDLLPRFPQSAGGTTANRGKDPRAVVYNGSPQEAEPAPVAVQGAEPAASGDGYDLSFENAPVSTVAKVILGDILGVGYIIDPRVQGTVTLNSGRPVAKSDVLFVLENALRASNVALLRIEDGYRLVPINEAIANGQIDVAADGHMPQPGYGVSVVPLRHVSAATVTKLLENFATRQGAVRVDSARNMLIIQGTGPERRRAVETVLSFDTDWMRGQSVGIFPVHHSTPEPIISEVEKIMDLGDGGLNHDLVKLQAIGRLNAILVATSKPALLKTAQSWIRRLDNSEVANTGVKVYRVRYGDAKDLAAILNEMFGSGTGTSISSASNEIAPGGGVTTSSSGPGGGTLTPVERLTGGPPASAQQPGSAASKPGATSAALANPHGSGAAAGGAVLPGVRITADVTNNSLLIYANEENYQNHRGRAAPDRPTTAAGRVRCNHCRGHVERQSGLRRAVLPQEHQSRRPA